MPQEPRIADVDVRTLVERSLGQKLDAASREAVPFSSETEFWRFARLRFLNMDLLQSLEQEFQGVVHLFGPKWSRGHINSGTWDPAVPGALMNVEDFLLTQQQSLNELWNQRIELTEPDSLAPRIIRLRDRIELSWQDLDILTAVVLFSSDMRFLRRVVGTYSSTIDVGDVAQLLALEPLQLLDFTDPNNPLQRHELVHLEERALGGQARRDLQADVPVVKMLAGGRLTEQERYSIGDGVLGKLLAEEMGQDVDPAAGEEPGEEEEGPVAAHDSRTAGKKRSEVVEADFDLDDFLRDHSASPGGSGDGRRTKGVYASDLDYLNDHLVWFGARKRQKEAAEEVAGRSDRIRFDETMSPGARYREAAATAQAALSRLRDRIQKTRDEGTWLPRAEELAETRGLDDFEKWVLLLAAGMRASPEFRHVVGTAKEDGVSVTVGQLLELFFDSLEDQVNRRRHFYRDAPLIRDGLISLSGFATDVLRAEVDIDRRMIDFLLGLEAESSSLVEGSHLFTSDVDMERVILPERDKELIVSAIENFPAYQRERKRSGLDEMYFYGTGLVLLFYGPSGTGKTMMAHALATYLGKRLLLINIPRLGPEEVKYVFREAKINDALLFFDECESLFEDRSASLGVTGMLLSELERHDGLVVMATNRPYELDEAMDRRITMAMEFRPPDATQREAIWKAHIPEKLPLDGEPDFGTLAYEWELTGGLIKNAVLAALAIATARDPDHPKIGPEDFEEGARRQLRGRLRMARFEDAMIPKRGLGKVVVPGAIEAQLREIVGAEKARRTLVSDWGFEGDGDRMLGTSALFSGPSGTGKTLAAEAIAYELGRPIKRLNFAQLLSKWVGEGAKNIQAVFKDARHNDAVLLFDEADALFAGRTAVASSTDRYANLDVSILLQELERFPGVVILTSNLPENIDEGFQRRLKFAIEFPVPDESARRKLWLQHVPDRLPVADDVDFAELAAAFHLTGAEIRNAVVKAASRAAGRSGEDREVSQEDLHRAAAAEARTASRQGRVGFAIRD